ncbi:multidrug effflux MFS transporter [Gordonia sp. MP11Mi]
MTATDRKAGPVLATLLLLLTVFGPISMDLYLPVLPALTSELGASTSAAQFTLTACLIGLAVGQMIAGPLSDRFGRKIPLVVGLVAYIVASVLCAVSPSIETLVVARLVQGLAGSVGIVIAQAGGRDVYSGSALIRFYGKVTVLGGLAAIIGPFLGGQLARFTDWRGTFCFLALLGAIIMVATLVIYRETLPAELRTTGGITQSGRDFRKLFSDRLFVGAVLVCGLTHAALFAYLSGATYILQDGYGLSPQGYAMAFGVNSAAYMSFGWIGGRTADRWSERGTLAAGVAITGLGSLGLLYSGLVGAPLAVVLTSLFVLASGVALAAPPAASLALADYPELAGTASSVLGCARFGLGGVAAPLVGLGGATAVLPLGVVTVACVVLALVALVALVAVHRPRDRDASHGPAWSRPESRRDRRMRDSGDGAVAARDDSLLDAVASSEPMDRMLEQTLGADGCRRETRSFRD